MKSINLIGPVDKRLVAYPLLKALDLVGKCLVITDDANFRRFADDYSLNFNYGNSDFIIIHEIEKFDESKDLDQPISVYDYVLYITTNTIVESDLIVYCHGLNKSFLTDEVYSKLQEMEHKEIYITPSKIKLNDIIQIRVGKNMDYVWACEENREFISCTDSTLTKVISSVFAEGLGMSKDELVQYMARKEA